MKRACDYVLCGKRRAHWTNPEVPRGTQMVEVPDNFSPDHPVFCSLTCCAMSGFGTLKWESDEARREREAAWIAGWLKRKAQDEND